MNMWDEVFYGVIFIFAVIYAVLAFAMIGVSNKRVRAFWNTITPVLFVSLACVAATGLGWIK
jgi:hypothetical protein